MKKKIFILCLIVLAGTLSARNRRSDISIQSSYIMPIDNTDFNNSLSLGLGARFWGIFQLSGHCYLEIDKKADKLSNRFNSPEVFSAGVGLNIPMGGFTLKGDYQKFFQVNENRYNDNVSLSNYSDSWKIGVGVDINHFLEAEFFHRTLIDSKAEKYFDEKQSIFGIGLNIYL